MAVYDDLSNLLTRFGRWIVRQTKGSYKAARLSHVIREEERKQDDLFRQIGEYYYQMYGKDADGQMKIWCDAIWNNKMMVIQYQSQKRLVKGVAYCPNCSQEVPMHSKYCNHCGARIITTPEIQTKETAPFSAKICPGCGAVITDGDVFCANCGGRIPEKKSLKDFVKTKVAEHKEKAEQERREEEKEFENVYKEVVAEVETKEAVLEEAKVEAETTIVEAETETGKDVDTEDKAVEVVEEQEVQKSQPDQADAAEQTNVTDDSQNEQNEETELQRTCHECGNPIEYGQNFCPKCGVKL